MLMMSIRGLIALHKDDHRRTDFLSTPGAAASPTKSFLQTSDIFPTQLDPSFSRCIALLRLKSWKPNEPDSCALLSEYEVADLALLFSLFTQ